MYSILRQLVYIITFVFLIATTVHMLFNSTSIPLLSLYHFSLCFGDECDVKSSHGQEGQLTNGTYSL